MAPSLESSVLRHGFWGPATSTIDWCEQNYEVTYYIAEFWNSVSNLMFIIPPLVTACNLKNHLDPACLMTLFYMAFTGVGSFAFHSTLRFSMQLWDELSMVWSGLFILYQIIRSFKGDSASRSYILPIILYGIGTCAIYLSSNTPVIFQVAYGFIHFTVLLFAFRLKNRYPVDMRLYWSAVILSSAGFLLWNIDNHMCPSLERIRSLLRPDPISRCMIPMTQFHALWHCLAGYGAFCMVLFVMQARLCSRQKIFSLSLHPLSGLTLEQVHSPSSVENEGPGLDAAFGRQEVLIVTQTDRSSCGTVTLISNAVSTGYTHLIKSYRNRKAD